MMAWYSRERSSFNNSTSRSRVTWDFPPSCDEAFSICLPLQIEICRIRFAVTAANPLLRVRDRQPLAALLRGHLCALLPRFRKANGNGLLPALHRAALAAFPGLQGSFLFPSRGTCDRFAGGFPILSASRFTFRHMPSPEVD